MNVDVDHYTDNRLANVDLNREQVNFANANLDFEHLTLFSLPVNKIYSRPMLELEIGLEMQT